jgi:hypothetical protein
MHLHRLSKAKGLAGYTFDPCSQRQLFSVDLLCLLLPARLWLRVAMSLVGPPSIGIDMRHTTWRSQLRQFYEPGRCLRSYYSSEDRAPGRVNRRPPPPLRPFVTNDPPHLVQLSCVALLDDDVPILWRTGP